MEINEDLKKQFLADYLKIDIKNISQIKAPISEKIIYRVTETDIDEVSDWNIVYTGISCHAYCIAVFRASTGMRKKATKFSIDLPANIYKQLLVSKQHNGCSIAQNLVKLIKFALSKNADED